MSSKVHPSQQVDSTLPRYIAENYEKFVEFMTAAAESEERISFGQDILQNYWRYRDFDFYQNRIVEYGILDRNYDNKQSRSQEGTSFSWIIVTGAFYHKIRESTN